MRNQFGFKDFILLVAVLGVGVIGVLSMFATDQKWLQFKKLNDDLQGLKTQVGTLSRSVEQRGAASSTDQQLTQVKDALAGIEARLAAIQASGVKVSGATTAAVATTPAPSTARAATTTTPAGSRDESWARPGVPIAWQPAWDFSTDPRSAKGFREGGSFTEIFDARPAKVTPYIQTDVYGRRVVDLVMETLGEYDPKTLRLRGRLADAWQVDPNGLWVRVRLREGIRWSDGTPMTVEDFRWAYYELVMNPQIEAQRTRSVVSDKIKSITAVSDRVIDFEFNTAMFDNLDIALTLYPLPKHLYSRYTPAQINSMPGLLIGSGPYKMRDLEWTPDKVLILERNENYWGPRPAVAEMRFRTITDEQPRLVAYRNGEADMTTPSSPQFLNLKADESFAKDNQLLQWYNMRSGRTAVIWNCGPRNGKLTPMADPRVRRAMTMILDREKMIRDIWKGIGRVPNGFVNEGSIGYPNDLKPWAHDIKAGLALLKDAGWEDRNGDGQLEDKSGTPFVFELTYFGGGEIAERIALFVKDAYSAVGIKVDLRSMDWAVGDPVRKQRDFDAMLMGWGANAPESDPKQIFHSDSIKDQGDNFAQWNNPEADKAIDALRTELDVEKREVHWRRFAQVMHEDQPYTWVRGVPFLRIVKGDVGNVQTYPKGLEYWEFFRGGAATPMPAGQ